MSQIMVRDAICADFLARSIKSLLAFADAKHFHVQWFVGAVAADPLKKRERICNQRLVAQFHILGGSAVVSPSNDFAGFKIAIPPFERVRLALVHPRNGQAE